MEKIIQKIFTFFFITFFCLTGFITIINFHIKTNDDSKINIEESFTNSIPSKLKRINLFPRYCWNKLLNKRFYFENSAYITDDKNIINGSFKEGDTTFALDNIKKLNEYAKKNKINFIYFILPGKPLYDEELTNMNIACYRNKSADNFIKQLKDNNIDYVDLRDNFRQSKENPYDWFYKTDHHWNSDAGLEAARIITDNLNNKYKMKLNSENLKPNKFERKVYKNHWLGETGKKLYASPLEKEDFITNIPNYKTNLIFQDEEKKERKKGDFSILLNEDRLKDDNIFRDGSLYYYYSIYNSTIYNIENLNNKKGNILYIKDSYSSVVIPFLALTSSKITAWDSRSGSNLYNYLNTHNKYDTIIVAYTISTIPQYEMNDFKIK